MRKSILIILLTITTLISGCGCGVTNTEADNTIVNTEAMTPVTNADRGNSVGEVVDTPTENQDVPEATVHIYRDENKNIVYSEELANAIRSIEGVSNFSDEDFEEIMYSYYLRVRKLDNTVIYPEHINSAVVVVAHEKGYEVGAVTYLDGFTESVNIDTGSESTGNTGGGNGGNSSNNNSNTSENDFVTPETGSGSGSDARPGETTRKPMDGGDGGEYVTDPNESLLNP